MDIFKVEKAITDPKMTSPFSSSTEDDKEVLNQKLELYRQKLTNQWTDVKEEVVSKGKNAAVIGGVVLGTYALMEVLLPKADDEEIPNPAPKKIQAPKISESTKKAGMDLSGALQSILWAAAMAWAKKKVTEFVVAERQSNVKREE